MTPAPSSGLSAAGPAWPRRWRQVAIPPEHGATALALTAVIAGALHAATLAAVAVAAALLLGVSGGNAALLVRGPLPPAIRPWARSWAVAALLAAAAALALLLPVHAWGMLALAGVPALLAVAVRLRLGPRQGRRHGAAQVLGLASLALLAALPPLAAEAAWQEALALGGGLALWSVLLTLAVRARLRGAGGILLPAAAILTSAGLAFVALPLALAGPLAWMWSRGAPLPPRRLGVQAALASSVLALALVLATR